MQLHQIYNPLTANPLQGGGYREYFPGADLAPYLHCFWSSAGGGMDDGSLVIPDGCMDILFILDGQTVAGLFAGINDRPVHSAHSGSPIFGIRFYAWSAALFIREHMAPLVNRLVPVPQLAGGWQALAGRMNEAPDDSRRILFARDFLLSMLPAVENGHNAPLHNALYIILSTHGRLSAREAAGYAAVSLRQLERIFAGHIGLSPKKVAQIIRFQSLWRAVFADAHQDYALLALSHGYTDQAHMIREFRRYTGITPSQV